jgi:hypothetical protein
VVGFLPSLWLFWKSVWKQGGYWEVGQDFWFPFPVLPSTSQGGLRDRLVEIWDDDEDVQEAP